MGKIFGISDLPVSTITSAIEITRVPEPKSFKANKPYPIAYESDMFVSKKLPEHQKNYLANFKNGIGKFVKNCCKKAR